MLCQISKHVPASERYVEHARGDHVTRAGTTGASQTVVGSRLRRTRDCDHESPTRVRQGVTLRHASFYSCSYSWTERETRSRYQSARNRRRVGRFTTRPPGSSSPVSLIFDLGSKIQRFRPYSGLTGYFFFLLIVAVCYLSIAESLDALSAGSLSGLPCVADLQSAARPFPRFVH